MSRVAVPCCALDNLAGRKLDPPPASVPAATIASGNVAVDTDAEGENIAGLAHLADTAAGLGEAAGEFVAGDPAEGVGDPWWGGDSILHLSTPSRLPSLP